MHPDYSGNENQWTLAILISKYFVPDDSSKKPGQNFYKEIQSKKVQKKLHLILAEI